MPKILTKNLECISRFRIESPRFDDDNLINAGFIKSIVFDDGYGGYVSDYFRK